jgi:hypothetical protein
LRFLRKGVRRVDAETRSVPSRYFITAIVLALLGAAPVCADACSVTVGQRILLASNAADPDVFVWDAKARMLDFERNSWRNTKDVMDHTAIAKPGTLAIVTQCEAQIVRSKMLPGTQDAIGLRLLSGPGRGTYGWVPAEDIRTMRVAAAAATPHPRVTRRP